MRKLLTGIITYTTKHFNVSNQHIRNKNEQIYLSSIYLELALVKYFYLSHNCLLHFMYAFSVTEWVPLFRCKVSSQNFDKGSTHNESINLHKSCILIEQHLIAYISFHFAINV